MNSPKFVENLHRDLFLSFTEARKRKLHTANEFRFEAHLAENLAQLADDILTRRYRPSRGIAFVNDTPVYREIFAAPFRDRVVHHLIIKHVEPWWDRHFINDSYSCRKGKGTDFGIRRLCTMSRRVSHNYQIPVVVLKYDIQGYFTSLPRAQLFDRVMWGLQGQFLHPGYTSYDKELFDMLSFLWQQVIFDDPTVGVSIKGERENWSHLPKRKSLFGQRPGIGIVIGNLTSQVVSNIYLDQLDRFISIELGYKNYGRYVDDFFIVLPESELEEFHRCVEPMIEDYIIGLGLTLHPKKRHCYPLEKGVPFLGARIYPYHVLPDYRIIDNYRRDLSLVVQGRKDIDSIVSYMGRLQHMDSSQLQSKIWEENGLHYRPDPHGGPNARYYTDPKMYDKIKDAREHRLILRPDDFDYYAGLE